jgi:glycosyltransferase involved in cell wall biosynthesis
MRDEPAGLTMMGTARSGEELTYLNCLQSRARSNTTFLPNVDIAEAKRRLWTSKVFLSTAESEPFGITVAEAVAAGCLPLVYDSGGPREIVPFPVLRFSSVLEAKIKLRSALSGRYDGLLSPLQQHIQQFGVDRFRDTVLSKIRAYTM